MLSCLMAYLIDNKNLNIEIPCKKKKNVPFNIILSHYHNVILYEGNSKLRKSRRRQIV